MTPIARASLLAELLMLITSCAAPSVCENGVLDDGESDVDCGGSCEVGCKDSQRCVVDSD